MRHIVVVLAAIGLMINPFGIRPVPVHQRLSVRKMLRARGGSVKLRSRSGKRVGEPGVATG